MNTKVCVTYFTEEAKQVTNLSDVTYDYMIGKEAPYWANKREWAKLTNRQKLVKHLDRIKTSMGAHKFTYKIFDDLRRGKPRSIIY